MSPRGTVVFITTGVILPPPLEYTFRPADHGEHSFRLALPVPGLYTITVQDTLDPSISGSVTIDVL
jgi:hypothetical protein